MSEKKEIQKFYNGLYVYDDNFYDMVLKLKEEDIENQVKAIVNYEENRASGRLCMATFFANCSNILKEQLKDREDNEYFNRSLDQSLEVIKNFNNYKKIYKRLKALKKGNEKNFILVPIVARGHVFSGIITKNNNDDYELTLINKGNRGEHLIFEEYIIPEKNIKKIARLCENMDYDTPIFNRSIENIYQVVEKYSIGHNKLENIDARNQIVGNCYYKEIEEGLRYIYSKAYNGFEIQGDKKVPKFPVSTKEFHDKLLYNIKNVLEDYNINAKKHNIGIVRKNKELIDFIEDIIIVYDENKRIRDFMKKLNGVPYEEKKKALYSEFNIVEDDFNDIKEKLLNKVDISTLSEHISFFVNVLIENNVYIPDEIMDVKNNIEKIYIINQILKPEKVVKEDNMEIFSFLQKNFEYVGKGLTDIYLSKLEIILYTLLKSWKDLIYEDKLIIYRNQFEAYKNRNLGYYERKKILKFLIDGNVSFVSKEEAKDIIRRYLPEEHKHNIDLDEISEALKNMPSNIKLIRCKEKMLENLGADNKEMLDDYTRFLALNPDNKDIREKRAKIYLDSQNYKDATKDYKLLGDDINIETRRNKIIALKKSGNIKDAIDEYKKLFVTKKYTIDDLKSAVNLLIQLRKIDDSTKALFKNILEEKNREIGYVRPSRFKFINKYFMKKKIKECEKIKNICVDFYELIKDYDVALKECDNLIDIYTKLGLHDRTIYMGTVKYRKTEILQSMKKDDEALKEILPLSKNKDIRINRKVREKVKLLSTKVPQIRINETRVDSQYEL